MWPAGSTGHPAPPSGCPSSRGPDYRSVAMPSGRATACSDCHQSTVSCAVLCAPFRAHLARQTRHHVTLSRPVRFRWQPVRPRRCSGPGQLPSHRPGGAAACRGRRQCTGDTGVLPSQGHVAVRTLSLSTTLWALRSPRRANGSIGHLLFRESSLHCSYPIVTLGVAVGGGSRLPRARSDAVESRMPAR